MFGANLLQIKDKVLFIIPNIGNKHNTRPRPKHRKNANAVILDYQVKKIVMKSGSQLSEL